MDYLNCLIGQKVVEIHNGENRLFPNDSNIKILEDFSTSFIFERNTLNVSAQMNFLNGNNLGFSAIGNNYVKSVSETSKKVVITFENNLEFEIDLNSETTVGPEHMVLHGPDHLCIVWQVG